jgi:flagellar protein FliO/FliZ
MGSMELFPYIVKIVSALAIVVGIMILSVYFVKKIMNRAGGRMHDEELIQILSTKYIGPKSSIMVVEVAGNVMILGLSNNQISYLKSIDNEASLERLRPLRDGRTGSGSFSDQLALCKTRLLSMCSFTQGGGKS